LGKAACLFVGPNLQTHSPGTLPVAMFGLVGQGRNGDAGQKRAGEDNVDGVFFPQSWDIFGGAFQAPVK